MEEDLFRIRRRMAKTSFIVILATLFVVLGIVFYGGEDTAVKLSAASGIIIMIVTALIGQVSHYSHLVHHTDKEDRNAIRDTNDP